MPGQGVNAGEASAPARPWLTQTPSSNCLETMWSRDIPLHLCLPHLGFHNCLMTSLLKSQSFSTYFFFDPRFCAQSLFSWQLTLEKHKRMQNDWRKMHNRVKHGWLPHPTHLQGRPHSTQNEEHNSSLAQGATQKSRRAWKDGLKEAIRTTIQCLRYLKTLGEHFLQRCQSGQ